MTGPNAKPVEKVANVLLRISDLMAEVDGRLRTDALGQVVVIGRGERQKVELHVEELGLKVHFWVTAEPAIAACHAHELRTLLERFCKLMRQPCYGAHSAGNGQPCDICRAMKDAETLVAKLDCGAA